MYSLMKADLLQAFGIKEATDKLCELADLPPIEWVSRETLTAEQLDEMNEFLSKD